MLSRPDQDGRYALSMREYESLRTLFAAISALDCRPLKERCDLIPGTWDALTKAKDELFKQMENILNTIPARKLVMIQNELHHSVCKIEVKGPATNADPDYVYIPRQSQINLLQRAIQMDCLLCDKNVKECKKCSLYKEIDSCFPYLLEEPNDTLCPFAGVSKLEVTHDADVPHHKG